MITAAKQSESPWHFLGIEGLAPEELHVLLRNSQELQVLMTRDIKKVPTLRGRGVINLFLEPSTRTRVSFELAAKRLSADAVNIGASGTSVSKGETLLDTAQTIEAMAPDILVIRHSKSGAPHFLAKYLSHVSVINAGDGLHEHPTQALLDCLTLIDKVGANISGLTVSIVGDVVHSRVARSNIWAHLLLGNKVRLVGPPTLVPEEFGDSDIFGPHVSVHHNLREGIEGADVVMSLRMQRERQAGFFVPDLDEYSRNYGINMKVLKACAPHAVVMHPGPMNRGIEITTEVADSDRALIGHQVANGLAVRMAVMLSAVSGRSVSNLGDEK